jgi:NAD-dependent SIR2 family protein deacetylase
MSYSEQNCIVCQCSWHESDIECVGLKKKSDDFSLPVCPECFGVSTELYKKRIVFTEEAMQQIIDNEKEKISTSEYIIRELRGQL